MPEVITDMAAAEKRTVWTIGAVLAVTIAFSTALHNFFPWVLSVPSNSGVPHTGLPVMFLMDLVPVALAALCFWHARRTLGLYSAALFLAGSFFFTGLEENVWIFIGRYIHLLGAVSPEMGAASGTYYFTRGFFWWGEIPVSICLAWFFIAYSCVYMSSVLLPRAALRLRAALGGFLAMDFDLWLDPVQVHPHWQSWVWVAAEPVKVLSVPLTNFAGWFLLIFLFALVFDRLPALRAKYGPGKAAAVFFLVLLGIEAAMLTSFMAYGYLAMKYITVPVNLTLWGI